jgi:hypothetical protein
MQNCHLLLPLDWAHRSTQGAAAALVLQIAGGQGRQGFGQGVESKEGVVEILTIGGEEEGRPQSGRRRKARRPARAPYGRRHSGEPPAEGRG